MQSIEITANQSANLNGATSPYPIIYVGWVFQNLSKGLIKEVNFELDGVNPPPALSGEMSIPYIVYRGSTNDLSNGNATVFKKGIGTLWVNSANALIDGNIQIDKELLLNASTLIVVWKWTDGLHWPVPIVALAGWGFGENPWPIGNNFCDLLEEL